MKYIASVIHQEKQLLNLLPYELWLDIGDILKANYDALKERVALLFKADLKYNYYFFGRKMQYQFRIASRYFPVKALVSELVF